MAVNALAAAYSASGQAWARGPARIYDRLAAVLAAMSPASLQGRLVLDVGAGTGAAGRAAAEAGATVVATDFAPGMLAVDRGARPPATVADARSLPFRDRSFGGVIAAFCYNHLPDPEAALREAARVTERGGVVLASAYAAADDHPVKRAVELALEEAGWERPPWDDDLRARSIPRLATEERARAAAAAAGIEASVELVEVPFPDLSPTDLVAWRMGMASYAPFLSWLDGATLDRVRGAALAHLGSPPALVRSFVVVAATV